jgi:hypothetical protein
VSKKGKDDDVWDFSKDPWGATSGLLTGQKVKFNDKQSIAIRPDKVIPKAVDKGVDHATKLVDKVVKSGTKTLGAAASGVGKAAGSAVGGAFSSFGASAGLPPIKDVLIYGGIGLAVTGVVVASVYFVVNKKAS